jgi:H+-translocating NAD(P) transhydrogenase subunit alpha
MASGLWQEIDVFVLALFVGFSLISRIPSVLHTPLMSATNAIHGVILVGALILAAGAHGTVGEILGFAAVLLATMNVVGGYVVTDRMLEMFRRSPGSGRSGQRG